jgi:hypothetical protein
VTLAEPVLDKVTVWGLLVLPTVTLPKLTLAGLTPRRRLPTPVPERDTVAGELVALLTTEIVPLAEPAAVGANVIVKVALCPPARVSGTERPLVLKPEPVTVSPETTTLALPVSVSVAVWEALLPTLMLPRLTLAGVTLS